jgi:hypothetical protein
MSMKNANDTIGNGTYDFPACSTVPQPTVLPAACPYRSIIKSYLLGERSTLESVTTVVGGIPMHGPNSLPAFTQVPGLVANGQR